MIDRYRGQIFISNKKTRWYGVLSDCPSHMRPEEKTMDATPTEKLAIRVAKILGADACHNPGQPDERLRLRGAIIDAMIAVGIDQDLIEGAIDVGALETTKPTLTLERSGLREE